MNPFEPYLPDREHFFLNHSVDGKDYFPINMSKSLNYLKGKIGPHRNCETNIEVSAHYSITDYDGKVLYTRDYQPGVSAKTNKPYHIEAPKPKISYTTAYVDKSVLRYVDGEIKEVIEPEPFEVICDSEGAIKTDLTLLKYLYDFRYYQRIPVMITNRALVSMATYMPLSKETFITLDGLGEKLYNKCGEKFIAAIKSYVEYKASHRSQDLTHAQEEKGPDRKDESKDGC